jgi:hypothetical protein
MADKPILFSGPMVRALIAGTKTQTRRALNPQPAQNSAGLWTWQRPGVSVQGDGLTLALAQRIAIGDRLYVREHWRTWAGLDGVAPRDMVANVGLQYEATAQPSVDQAGRFRQGMHMPRWASRLTLTVTDVRVERLHDISEADAIAEGIATGDYPVDVYASLWDSINGPGSWAGNPWVAAYTFTIQMGNIDALPLAA